MSKDETTQPAQRWTFGDVKQNPPWTGLYFVCEHCGAKFQLGAADECDPVSFTVFCYSWLAPECWTCGHRNVVHTPRLDPASRNAHPAL